MKLCVAIVFCSLVMGVGGEGWFTLSLLKGGASFFKQALQGTGDLWRAYRDMQEANYQNSDRYFHARGNYDAAQRGPGGIWAAKVVSNARKYLQMLLNQYYFGSTNHGLEDIKSNQKAEEWGRSGKDPNHFRPSGLPEKF